MNISTKKLKMYAIVGIITCAISSSTDFIARPNTIKSKLWNNHNKIAKIIKLGIEGAVAVYAIYMALERAFNSRSSIKILVDRRKSFAFAFKRLLYNACIIAGLGSLAHICGDGFLYDLEHL